jgi:hypothetical protein
MIGSIVSLFIGAVLSVIVSHYYYKRSMRHQLSIYSLQFSRLFRSVDSAIRKALTVQFHGAPVEQLIIAELLVANEGVHAVRDCVQPLRIALPDHARFVDASIVHVHPDGRQVSATLKSERECTCEFDILNAGDYFLVRLLVDGRIKISDLIFSIVAENLPPRLLVKTSTGVETVERSGLYFTPLIAGGAFALLGGSALASLVILQNAKPSLFPFPPSGYELSIGSSLAILGTGVLGVFLSLFGLLVMASSPFGGSIPPPRRFPLPGHVRRDRMTPHALAREIEDL